MDGGLSTTSSRAHIDELSGIVNQTCAGHYLEAVVALIWPYSSNTRRLSLLLVEEDVAIYKKVGQVKATFYDRAARELATLRVGIGDKVRVSLENVQVTHNDSVVSTPGRKTHWELHFRRSIHIEVCFLDVNSIASLRCLTVILVAPMFSVAGPLYQVLSLTDAAEVPIEWNSCLCLCSSIHRKGSNCIDITKDSAPSDIGYVPHSL